jgi:uncharacterized lipoprotein YbaY
VHPFEHLNDTPEHTIQVIQDLVIPETQHPVTLRFQYSCAFEIVGLPIEVLAAIHLDDQFLYRSTEIHDVAADGVLPAKVDVVHLVPAQHPPEPGLCIGRAAA